MKHVVKRSDLVLLSATLTLGLLAASPASADLFQVEMTFESELIPGEFSLSALMSGTDDSDPEEPWETFAIDDDGPWAMTTESPLLEVTADDFMLGYGPTFAWGSLRMDIVDLVGPDQTDLLMDFVISGPEWDHDSIGGTGSGTIHVGSDTDYAVAITSWQITLVPAPAALCGLLGLPVVLRRRRS